MNNKHKHKSKITLFLLVLFFQFSSANAYDYKTANIPDSLKENSVAVVRNMSLVYIQHDMNSATRYVTEVITILNDRGNGYAHFVAHEDKFRELNKFEGVVRSDSGKEIRKIRKKDLKQTSISEHLASDDVRLYYEVISPVYPYTVEYTYEMKYKNGIIGYPAFSPIQGEKIAVEKISYKIEVPLDIKLRINSNFECKRAEEKTAKSHIYSFQSEGIKAIEYEPLSPPFAEYAPVVKIAPSEFCYDKVCGDFSSWQSYGLWQKKLLEERDILAPSTIQAVKDLTKDISDNREKVAAIYKYLQDNSRYVSIQLGIGGFQPISAESTIKNRYGDCKGLTNLMMAMLKVVDIPSNYSEISMGGKKYFLHDFPDALQTNHVILRVPLPNDTIWLECTSQTLPMGYIHRDIAGHDALVITDNGGEICQLPSYTSEQNLSESTIVMNIERDGKVKGQMSFTEHVHGFGDYYWTMRSNDRERHVKYINERLSLSRINIGQISTSEELSDLPLCTLQADYTADDVINVSGQRMFIPLLPIKKRGYSALKSNKRERDIWINDDFCDSDSVTINLPEGCVVESLPKPQILVTPFGVLVAKASKKGDNAIVYKQEIRIFSGRHDKSKYEEIKSFLKSITDASAGKVVVKKTDG